MAGNDVSLPRAIRAIGLMTDAAATGAVTSNDTVTAYIKQLVTAAIVDAADSVLLKAQVLPYFNGTAVAYGFPGSKTIKVSTPDGSATTWTQAAHRIATVTSACAVRAWALCTETITGAATAELGVAGATDMIIDQIANASTLAAGDVWCNSTTDSALPAGILDSNWIIVNGIDIDLLIGSADVTNGVLDIYIQYIPLTATGACVAAVWD